MRKYLPLGCLALALAGPAYGQSPRLKFLDVPSPDHSITGRFTLRVSDDPFTRSQNARVIIKMDGQLLAECNRTPCELAWETEGVEDGRHLLQLALQLRHTRRLAVPCDYARFRGNVAQQRTVEIALDIEFVKHVAAKAVAQRIEACSRSRSGRQ